MAVNKVVKIDGSVIIDLSTDTVTSSAHIMAPYIGHLADGTQVTGTGTGSGGGDSGYTLTTIVPQQTVTPTSSDGTYKVDLSYLANLEEGADYIVTINGAEYWTTCVLMWGTNYLIGDINHFWSSDEQPYPFGIINENNAMTIATSSGSARTVKVEKIELTGSGGGGGGGITTEILMDDTITATEQDTNGYVTWLKTQWIDYMSDTLVDDTNYVVTIDGTPYLCHANAVYGGGDIYCGDTEIVWGTPANSIYPFAIGSYISGNVQWMIGDNQPHSVKVERVISMSDSTILTTKTITANGTYSAFDDSADGYSEVTVSIPNGTAGTPTATKGTVSNNSVTITPSVTNTTGYITGGTLTGTGVTVSASELVSGSQTITENNTYNVTNLASIVVNVPSGGGTAMNTQVAQGTTRANTTSYTEVISLTCDVAGTYDVYWSTFRSSTSSTWGSQLYINDSAYGSADTGNWSNHIQNKHLTGVQLTAGQKVSVRVRSRGNSYYGYVGTLTIKQTA